ncbi:MAG: hypothetical protein IJ265_03390 [Oscillospiraceae bacterium]|nr:hypothetical protein [Oscillospiraceae bacterium]
MEINTFPPEFQQRVENWVEKFSRKFQRFGEDPTKIPLFHENRIPQAVKRNFGRRDFPQNFQEIFPFHSTISAHFHGKKCRRKTLHFCTFSQKRQCGMILRKKYAGSSGNRVFNFSAPPTTTTIFI